MTIDCLVIGAGAIGLAAARALARAGFETVILEAERRIGTGISARNSEVIHAGLYYPPGSAKARLCRRGRDLLYDYCATRHIPHRRLGKLIVAGEARQYGDLVALAERAAANGVADIEILSGAEAQAMEPALRAEAALFSPATGILDAQALMRSLLGEAEEAGAALAFAAPFLGARRVGDSWLAEIGGDDPTRLETRCIVNAAGLAAHDVARACGQLAEKLPPLHFAKGNYFLLSGQANPFRHLVYPLPEPGGLGIHLTLDLAGAARFGPDVEWIERLDFAIGPDRARLFYPAIRTYFPDLREGALVPGYSGIRPKLAPAGGNADFLIQGESDHGMPGLINLLGIESPGLTSALAIAEIVVAQLGGKARPD